MRWAALVARLLVGFVFAASSVMYFLIKFKVIAAEMPAPPTESAGQFMHAVGPTGYMDAVKVFELVGGLLLLAGRFVPLGVVLVAPVAVNIAFYELFLAGKPGIGFGLVALLAVVVAGHWPAFRGLVAAKG